MAKFELPIYNAETGEIAKTYKRDFMPTGLYIRFLKFSEKLVDAKLKTDAELFLSLKDLMLETFSELTEDEYFNNTDAQSVLKVWSAILSKSATIESGKSKNA